MPRVRNTCQGRPSLASSADLSCNSCNSSRTCRTRASSTSRARAAGSIQSWYASDSCRPCLTQTHASALARAHTHTHTQYGRLLPPALD